MFDNYKSLPLMAAVTILFLIPVSIGGFVYSQIGKSDTEQQEGQEEQALSNDGASLNGREEAKMKIVPLPETESSGVGQIFPDQEIPTGKYSNPPSTIQSFGGGEDSSSSPPIENLAPERDQTSSILDTPTSRFRDLEGSAISDYSNPSSSNDFNSRDNSLINPLEEEDNLLEISPSENPQELPSIENPLLP